MTRGDVADYLGLTIETVSRTFSKMKAGKLIALPTITDAEVLDRHRLRHVAEAA
ncbi:MAG TPA: helix-turn-helix domain-containing protein [Acetobacteraceae bacterium]|jgi:CRP/FNR family transcriptional regulator|nr:helix-turn-helix domain-containing protein [Acetobacteraceae bacterium]